LAFTATGLTAGDFFLAVLADFVAGMELLHF
jgi:hypothetical protein